MRFMMRRRQARGRHGTGRLRRAAVALALAGVGGLLPPAHTAADDADLAEMLSRRILAAEAPRLEVEDFVIRRLPPPPRVESAEAWNAEARRLRDTLLEQVVFQGVATAWRDTPPQVEWLDTLDTPHGYRIRKLRYTAVPGLWIPAVLYEPADVTPGMPIHLAVNGHDPVGKAAPAKQIRCINMARRGMLVLNVEWLGMGQLRVAGLDHGRLNQLDLCGTSGLAVFFLALRHGVDVLLAHPAADADRLSVAGLSGGGWQTILLAALDPRVAVCNPVAGYADVRSRLRHPEGLGDSEQSPVDLLSIADYTTLTAMLAPRPVLLTYNAADECCFQAAHALPPLIEAAAPIYDLFGRRGVLRTHVNHEPGTHNFERENREALYRLLGDHVFGGGPFTAAEIPCDDELLSAEQLHVPLPPEPSVTFHSLAVDLARDLPRAAGPPADPAAVADWLAARRGALAAVTRTRRVAIEAVAEGPPRAVSGGSGRSWWLRVGGEWTVPATEFAPAAGGPAGSLLILADTGRHAIPPAVVRESLDRGLRVVAIDPYLCGESCAGHRDFQFALQVAGVGERPLGIQATQIAATARWLAARDEGRAVAVVALGPRTSLASLVAAAVEPDAIGGLELHDPLPTLRQVVDGDVGFEQAPEYFCFGLLREFDVDRIAALAAPRPLTVRTADAGLTRSLAMIGDWFRRLGGHPPVVQPLVAPPSD